jgi:arylsulfatase A-like enzyme
MQTLSRKREGRCATALWAATLICTGVLAILSPTFARAADVAVAPAKRPPNIICILADDLGYGDVGCYGCPDIPTPHIDSIAKAGVRFTQAYAYPTCSPTRAALLMGRYAERLGISKALMGEDAPKLAGATSVAELLQAGGYATGIVGKWHLGYSDDVSPLSKGFDEFFGFRGGKIDFYRHTDTAQKNDTPEGKHDLWEGNNEVTREGYSTDLFTARAQQFIRDHAGAEKPFFLYLAYNAPHYAKVGLWQAPEEYLKRFDAVGDVKGRNIYRAMVSCMDDGIGKVLEELAAQKIDGNTLVLFMSDNGPDTPGSAKPLSGAKATYKEGGVRVPWIARLPGAIPPGSVRSDVVHVTDFLPTMLAVAGVPLPSDAKLDGQNVWPAFTGGPAIPERTIQFSDRGIRQGKWKWLNGSLYDIETDPTESKDVGDANPEVRDRLASEVKKWADSVGIKPATKPATKKAAPKR